MLNILLTILLIITILIITFLLIGIKVKLEYSKKEDDMKGYLKIFIFKKIKIYSQSFPEKSEKSEKNSKKRDMKGISKLAKPCLNDLIDYLKSIIKTLKIKKIKNHLIIGFESYADTGKYIGIIWAVLSVINTLDKNLKISAEPTFTKATLNAYGENEFEIYPIKLIIPTVRLLLKKNVRQLIKGVINERRN